MFKDRRQESDRRQVAEIPDLIAQICRRSGDRRSGNFDSRPWWLRTNYCEHLLSPELLVDNKDAPKTRQDCGNTDDSHPKQA